MSCSPMGSAFSKARAVFAATFDQSRSGSSVSYTSPTAGPTWSPMTGPTGITSTASLRRSARSARRRSAGGLAVHDAVHQTLFSPFACTSAANASAIVAAPWRTSGPERRPRSPPYSTVRMGRTWSSPPDQSGGSTDAPPTPQVLEARGREQVARSAASIPALRRHTSSSEPTFLRGARRSKHGRTHLHAVGSAVEDVDPPRMPLLADDPRRDPCGLDGAAHRLRDEDPEDIIASACTLT